MELWNTSWEQWEEGERLPDALTGPGMAVLDGPAGQLGPVLIGGRGLAAAPTKAVTAMAAGGDGWEEDSGMTLQVARAFAGVATVPSTLFDGCRSSKGN